MKLRRYQETGSEFLRTRQVAILGDVMRLGKTRTALHAAKLRAVDVIVVIGPAIARDVWRAENEAMFGHGGKPLFYFSFQYVSRNGAGAVLKSFEPTLRYGVIIDECHNVRNPKAKIARAVFSKRGLISKAAFLWGLSGTPYNKAANELWLWLNAAGLTDLRYSAFVDQFCNVRVEFTGHHRPPRTTITGTKPGMLETLRELCSPLVLRRTWKSPEVQAEMPDVASGIPRMFVRPMSAQRPSGIPDDTAEGAAQLLDQMRYADNSMVPFGLMKVQPTLTLVESAVHEGHKCVVFCIHRDVVRCLLDGLRKLEIDGAAITGNVTNAERAARIGRFRNGDLQVLVCNIHAAGTAIDLSAASYGVFTELSWLPSDNVQAAYRLASVGKTEPAVVDLLTWPGTADEAVVSLNRKRFKQLQFLFT